MEIRRMARTMTTKVKKLLPRTIERFPKTKKKPKKMPMLPLLPPVN